MRPELRWLVMTALIVGVLLAISALALDRPDVVWTTKGPECPACRSDVAQFATKCKECDTEFDWTIAPDEVSPISNHSLSRLEAVELRSHVKRLGKETAIRLIAEKLELKTEDAEAYLESLGRGRCGYCGGTGEDLGAEQEGEDCPICFGDENCIASGGSGRSTWGDSGAARAYERMDRKMRAMSPRLPEELRLLELERLARDFLSDHAGTTEAAKMPYWKDWSLIAAEVGRERLDVVMTVLRNAKRP